MNFAELKNIGISLLIAFNKMRGKKPIHFLHIGKTAGTAIKNSFGSKEFCVYGKHLFIFHGHTIGLSEIPNKESVFFIVRDPISRFVSGFYSRYRMGMPRTYNPWKNGEEEAFKEFSNPNSLAEALSCNDGDKRKHASEAMRSIGHVKTSYYDWFQSPETLKSNIDRIQFVAVQEDLNAEFERLKCFFNLPDSIRLPKDDIRSHKNPISFNRELSLIATENLRNHYKSEYEFLNILYEYNLINKKYD